jgi:hypothetical protein
MKKLVVVLAAALSCVAVASAEAQKLDAGKWTGSITAPGEQTPLQVTYDVAMKGDTIDITVSAAEHGQFRFSDVKLAGDVLTFWFQPGPRVECTLTRRQDDGAYAGSCSDPEGGNASMVMIPPKRG